MSLFPDPLSDALVAKLESHLANAIASSQLSGWVTFLWTLGKKNLLGFGPAFQAMATAQLQSLRQLETKGFLVLTVPNEMLAPENLAKYQTEFKAK